MKRRDEVLVGVFVTVTLIVAIFGTLWLARRGLGGGFPLYTRFEWGANLKQGQPVLLAGIQVGNVDDVEIQRDGHLFVTMKIDDKYEGVIPEGTTTRVQAVGIFGDAALALVPPTRTLAGAPIPPRDTLPAAKPAPTIDEMLSRVDTIGKHVSDVAESFEIQMVQGGGIADLRKAIGSTNQLITQLNAIAAEQSRQLSATMASLRRTANAIDSSVVDSTVRNLQLASKNMTEMTANLGQAAGQLDSLLAAVRTGTGSAAMLLNDSTLYTSTRNLVSRLDSLVADLKKNPKRYINVKIF